MNVGINSRMLNKEILSSDKTDILIDTVGDLKALSIVLLNELFYGEGKTKNMQVAIAPVIYDIVKLEQIFNISDKTLEQIILSEQYKKEN